MKTETRGGEEASTIYCRQQKAEENEETERRICIYNISEFSIIIQCQSVSRLDDREEFKRDMSHDWNTKKNKINRKIDDKYCSTLHILLSHPVFPLTTLF